MASKGTRTGNQLWQKLKKNWSIRRTTINLGSVMDDNINIINFLKLILPAENWTLINGKQNYCEAKYFSVFCDQNNNVLAQPVYIDTSDGLNGFFIRDGIHDRWVTKKVKQESGITSDGKKEIKDLVFPSVGERTGESKSGQKSNRTMENKSSVRNINKIYQTNQINIWPENAELYKRVGEQTELYQSIYSFKEVVASIIEIINNRQGLRKKKNEFSRSIESLLHNLDFILENNITIIEKLFRLCPALVNCVKLDDDEGFIVKDGGNFDENTTDTLAYKVINSNNSNINYNLNEWLQWYNRSIANCFNFDKTVATNLGLNQEIYGQFGMLKGGLSDSRSRSSRRSFLNKLFLGLALARGDTYSFRSIDNGVSNGLNDNEDNLVKVQEVATVGKIFDMIGSGTQYGEGFQLLPQAQHQKCGYIISIKIYGYIFIMYVHGDGNLSAKCTIWLINTNNNNNMLISNFDIDVSADKKKVHQNAIAQKVSDAINVVYKVSGQQEHPLVVCCAGLVKHSGDIGMLLTNIGFLQMGARIAVVTHDSWLMYAASNCYYDVSCTSENAIPIRIVFAPSPQLSGDFLSFVRYEYYLPTSQPQTDSNSTLSFQQKQQNLLIQTYNSFSKKEKTIDNLSLLVTTLTVFKENFLENEQLVSIGKSIQNYILSRRSFTFSTSRSLTDYIMFCWYGKKNQQEKNDCQRNTEHIYNTILQRLDSQIKKMNGGKITKKIKKNFSKKSQNKRKKKTRKRRGRKRKTKRKKRTTNKRKRKTKKKRR
tara:strand:+ start:2773 stop:5073 length:2301 start_codon:yes stop_codon:yes gene_type:complete